MKKSLLIGIACLATAGVYAQSAGEPKILEEFYAQKISPDGKWIYSNTGTGESIIYNLATDEYNVFNDMSLGNGNPFADDGTAVGCIDMTTGIIIKGKDVIKPAFVSQYWFSAFNGITPDGSRIVGIVANPNSSGTTDEINQMYFPFYCDIDAEGNYSEPNLLPRPDEDFLGMVPQYSSAIWVSSDGKTILGQLIDYSGMFIQPIVYREGADGEWSYTLPSKPLYNPEGIELPPYPGEFDSSLEPDPTDYMSEEMAEMYEDDYLYWQEHYMDEEPPAYPGDNLDIYMDEEQFAAYLEALAIYEDYIRDYNEKITAFFIARGEIFNTSVAFEQNACCMNAEGTLAAFTDRHIVDKGGEVYEQENRTFLLDLSDDSMKMLESQYTTIFPQQVLDNNVIIGATPMASYIASYVYVPGSKDYIPVEEYLGIANPAAAEWMEDNLMHEIATGGGGGGGYGIETYSTRAQERADGKVMLSGLGMASNDFSVFAAGEPAYMFHPTLTYMTYIFSDLASGIKNIAVSNNADVRAIRGGNLIINGEVSDLAVIDLSGRKVFGMQTANGCVATNLNRGIYVVTYKDNQGRRQSKKVNF